MSSFHDFFVNVIDKDPQVRSKTNDMLDRYNRLPLVYRSKIGYDTLIQNVIPEKLIIIMGTSISDLDKELKRKISRIKSSEKKYYNIIGRM